MKYTFISFGNEFVLAFGCSLYGRWLHIPICIRPDFMFAEYDVSPRNWIITFPFKRLMYSILKNILWLTLCRLF